MSCALAAVQRTTGRLSHGISRLPTPLVVVVTVFNKIHRMWRWYRLGKIYSNPNNFLQLIAGHGLGAAFGKSIVLQVAAFCVLLATRLLECVRQQYKLLQSVNYLRNAFKNYYPTPLHISWRVKKGSSFFSPSTIAWWQLTTKKIHDKIQRILLCFLQVFKEAFVLSMRITDTVETCFLGPKREKEGINLLFYNTNRWMGKLVENKKLLIHGLMSHQKTINIFLRTIHAPLKAEQVIKGVQQALDKTEKVHNATQKIFKDTGVFLGACVKNWVYESMYTFGLNGFMPKGLRPHSIPPFVTPLHKKVAKVYIPASLITKPSMLKAKMKRARKNKRKAPAKRYVYVENPIPPPPKSKTDVREFSLKKSAYAGANL